MLYAIWTNLGAVYSNNFRYGTSAVHFNRFHCSGSEVNLTSCPQTENVASTCTHRTDVGVICRGITIVCIHF